MPSATRTSSTASAGWSRSTPSTRRSTPVKRTALGRAAHEGAWIAVTQDGRAVVYSGEDARFEYIYKFVSRDTIAPGGAKANATLLDHGTLYVARFDADGSGRWLPLVQGQGPLTAANGFADQGAVVIRSRQASDLLGATKMDRPEWLAIDQKARTVYCTLTNNSSRGAKDMPGVDAANPRANNVMGQIIQWTEDGDFDAHGVSLEAPGAGRRPGQSSGPRRAATSSGDIFACPDASTGVHSNGLSLSPVRSGKILRVMTESGERRPSGRKLLTPTRMYHESLKVAAHCTVHGMCHVILATVSLILPGSARTDSSSIVRSSPRNFLLDPKDRRHSTHGNVPHFQHGHGVRVCCPEGERGDRAEDGERGAGGRERGEGARGVVREDGDNVKSGILLTSF